MYIIFVLNKIALATCKMIVFMLQLQLIRSKRKKTCSLLFSNIGWCLSLRGLRRQKLTGKLHRHVAFFFFFNNKYSICYVAFEITFSSCQCVLNWVVFRNLNLTTIREGPETGKREEEKSEYFLSLHGTAFLGPFKVF